MTYQRYYKPVEESKQEHQVYRERYWALSHDLLKAHNWYYDHHQAGKDTFNNRYINIYADDERQLALLQIHDVVANPGESGPGCFVFFAEGEMVLLNLSHKHHYEIADKVEGVVFNLMTFEVQAHFKGREEYLKLLIIESFACKAKSRSNKFVTITEVDVMFDQPFRRLDIPR